MDYDFDEEEELAAFEEWALENPELVDDFIEALRAELERRQRILQ
jgi:hypothetical protein